MGVTNTASDSMVPVGGTPTEPISHLTESVLVTDEMICAFIRATGDDNPIHTSDIAARSVRLPGRIAHGKLIQSIGVNLIRVKEGNLGYLPILLEDRWVMNAPVYPGDRIYVRYRKSSPHRKCRIEATITVVDPRGGESIACEGFIQALVKRHK